MQADRERHEHKRAQEITPEKHQRMQADQERQRMRNVSRYTRAIHHLLFIKRLVHMLIQKFYCLAFASVNRVNRLLALLRKEIAYST